MSYLTLAKGIPNFSKAVISLWFKVPKESVKAANAEVQSATNVLPRIIPLLTFGAGLTIEDWEPVAVDVAVAMNSEHCPAVTSPATYTMIGTFPILPCYVGVDCRGVSGSNPTLTFGLQTEQHSTGLSNIVLTRMEVYEQSAFATPPPSDANPDIPGNGWNQVGEGFYVGFAAAFKDWPQPLLQQPEYFDVRSPKEITPDHWHHLLLSFDLSPGCRTRQREDVDEPGTIADATSAYCKFWYAIDDVNYDGEDNLGPYAVGSGNTNGILSANAWDVANSFHLMVYNTVIPALTCSFGPGVISTAGHEIGMPAAAKYVGNIYRVEMAELQMWTGVTLDTKVLRNRRAFVHSDGTPVDPTKGTEDDPRGPGERILGKKPEVLLHGSGDWKTGYNSGTLGIKIESDGTITVLPNGQFEPTGGIEQYSPDPALEESTA